MLEADNESKAECIDSVSNFETMTEYVADTIEPGDQELGVYESDSEDDGEGGIDVGAVSGELGTSPGVSADEYNKEEEELFEDQGIFNVFRQRPWGFVRYEESLDGTIRLGSDGDVSEISLGTDEEDMMDVCGDPTHPTHDMF